MACFLLGFEIDFQFSIPNMLNELQKPRQPTRRILLVDTCRAAGVMSEKLVLIDDYHVEVIANLRAVPAVVQASEPDLLVLMVDSLTEFDLESLILLKNQNPIPVVVFAQQNTLSAVKSVVEAGVSTYIVDDVSHRRLPVIVDLAIERFSQTQRLNGELEQTKRKLSERKLIEKAKGIVMRQRNLTEDLAYLEMRKSAMNQGKPMAELATRIISTFDQMLD